MPIQIENLAAPPKRASDPIVGIDLGTTNSLVAIVQDGQPQVLQNQRGG
ncbi:MAG: Hsp70 family protein, partial [Bdellovibrionia bacterium]